MTLPQATGTSGLDEGLGLGILVGIFVLVVVGAAALGRRGHERDPLTWVPHGLERLTGIPGWAAAMVGMSWWGLLVAGIGFYNDVAWHVGLGRDEELFTTPHTMIVLGLAAIAGAAVIGIFFATWTAAPVAIRRFGLRIPRSAVVMGLFGAFALSGFPLDELWHREFGIDVTMWSPTHLLMIVGASLSPLAGWLALAEAGVEPRRSAVATGVFVALSWITLMGLSSVLGEFEFGVPQFQQLYHPVLLAVATGFTFVLVRLRIGPITTLAISVLPLATRGFDGALDGGLQLETRLAGVYVASAVVVVLVGWLVGTVHRLRFAVVSGVGIGTVGLAAEWWWNQSAFQPWGSALFPAAFVWGAVAAVGAAVLGAAFAGATARERLGLPGLAVVGGAALVLLALLVPLPRTGTSVDVAIRLSEVTADDAVVEVTLDPPDAAEDARWFQVISWQGGGAVFASLEPVSAGVYRSSEPVPISGSWKTLVRLHKGSALVAAPVYLPADPEIGEPEIPAVDRQVPFVKEQRFLLREQQPGAAVYAAGIGGTVLLMAAGWMAGVVWAARSLGQTRQDRDGTKASAQATMAASS